MASCDLDCVQFLHFSKRKQLWRSYYWLRFPLYTGRSFLYEGSRRGAHRICRIAYCSNDEIPGIAGIHGNASSSDLRSWSKVQSTEIKERTTELDLERRKVLYEKGNESFTLDSMRRELCSVCACPGRAGQRKQRLERYHPGNEP
jgi:hypothetical protein